MYKGSCYDFWKFLLNKHLKKFSKASWYVAESRSLLSVFLLLALCTCIDFDLELICSFFQRYIFPLWSEGFFFSRWLFCTSCLSFRRIRWVTYMLGRYTNAISLIVLSVLPAQNGAHFLAHNLIFYASDAAVKKGTTTKWKQAENLVIYCLNTRRRKKHRDDIRPIAIII